MDVEENLKLMKTLDDAWNAGPGSPLWERFRKRHTENACARPANLNPLEDDITMISKLWSSSRHFLTTI